MVDRKLAANGEDPAKFLADVHADEPGTFDYEASEEPRLVGIPQLASLQFSPIENSAQPEFHLRLTLACGTGELTGADARYDVNLRQCMVAIVTENCDADLATAYSYELPPEIIAETYRIDASTRTSTDTEVEGSAGMAAAAMKVLRGTFKGRASHKAAGTESRASKGQGRRRIMLIACNGQYWIVGDDDHGDPRNHEGRLRELYFHEHPDKPLCKIKVKTGARTAKVTIEARAKFGQLDVDVLDDFGRPSRKLRRGDVEDVTRALKNRLKGMVVAKNLREQQKERFSDLPPAEFIFARRTLIAHLPEQIPEADRPAPDRTRTKRRVRTAPRTKKTP